jgi:tetratricopeptide (TPR) repeat protein
VRRATLAALALALAAAPAARADDTWTRPAESSDTAIARRTYEREMQTGEEYLLLAAQPAVSGRDHSRLLERALLAFENASHARPDAPEPHFRIGQLIDDFFVGCPTFVATCHPGRMTNFAASMAEHWTAFERLAPLDPRVDRQFLFARALAHTHAAAAPRLSEKAVRAHIEAALVDYVACLARLEPQAGGNDEQTIYSNMAETYMMLGRLDEAIATYREALRRGQSSNTLYGLAVALDRDEQGAQAREIILALGTQTFESFKQSVVSRNTFYVPDGEVFYYLALAEEALGQPDDAIADWDHYILSGAHPEFQPRAKANRDWLKAGHGRRTPARDDGAADRSR